MKIFEVSLPSRTYPIYVGKALLNQKNILASHVHGHQVLIVTQENIARFYLDQLRANLKNYQCDTVYLPLGEHFKNITEWQKIIDILLQQKHERTTTLIALGGGVVGDMTGFAAACYQRGVNYIQIPTTLMAQVDSSIGGKTGINHFLGKNMIGAFHHPQCVMMDINMLMTLPKREFISGLAEVIKYGLIRDKEFFCYLEEHMQPILAKDLDHLQFIIEKSIAIKSQIVMQDEYDLGIRKLLNFGHTFGHAIEAVYDYNTFLHGEAVALGMLMASQLSYSRGMLSFLELQRIANLINQLGLKQKIIDRSTLIEFMQRDKKIIGSKLNVILLNQIGKGVVVSDVKEDEVLFTSSF